MRTLHHSQHSHRRTLQEHDNCCCRPRRACWQAVRAWRAALLLVLGCGGGGLGGGRSRGVAAGQLALGHQLPRERLELGLELRQRALPRHPQALAALQLLPAVGDNEIQWSSSHRTMLLTS